MAFIDIVAGRAKEINIKAGFYEGYYCHKEQEKRLLLQLHISKEIIESLSLKTGDLISLSYDENNENIWFLRKSPFGYKLQSKQGRYYSVLLTWKLFPVPKEDRKRRIVEHKLYKDGVKIFWKKKENIYEKNTEAKST